VAFAENVQKLSAVCLGCQQEAHFTYKHSNNTGETNDIGGIDKYIPVCRGCFKSYSCSESVLESVRPHLACVVSGSSETKHSESGAISTKENSPISGECSDDDEDGAERAEYEEPCTPENPQPRKASFVGRSAGCPLTQPYQI
jgi:Thymidine kinase